MTIYEELGIPKDASEKEIRQSIRALSKMLHPDLHHEATARRLAEAQMKRLSGMAETLRNRKRNADYDVGLEPEPEPVRSEINPAWLWLSSLVVTVSFGYCLWQMMPAPGSLADSLFGSQVIAEDGPVILSSPNHMEPIESLN